MRLTLLLTSISALIHASAAYGPIVVANEEFSESTGITCSSKVSVDCTFPDANGNLRSCIAEETNGPFLQIKKSDCVNYGVNGIIETTITMKMCNENTEQDFIFRPRDGTYFKIATEDYFDGFLETDENGVVYSLAPANAVNGEWPPIFPGECKTMVQKYKFDVCNKPNKLPFGVQMQGNMNTALTESRNQYYGQSYCYAYVNRKNVVRRFPDDIEENPNALASPAPLVVEKNSNVNNCGTKLSMTCEFEFNGKLYSCIHEEEEDARPVLVSMQDECANNNFMATITLQMCNEHSSDIVPFFEDNRLRPLFNFDGQLLDEKDIQDGNRYNTVMEPDNATRCKTITISREIDACRRKVPMAIRIYGKTPDENGVICRSYMYREIFMEKIVIPPPILPTPSPTKAPTGPSTTTTPTNPPNTPDEGLTSAPSTSPTAEFCDFENVIITEVVDPDISPGGWRYRYTELRFLECAGKVITDDIKFVRWPLNGTPLSTDLQGIRVPNDGFIILCAHMQRFSNLFGAGKCDIEADGTVDGGTANNPGSDTVAVVLGTPSDTTEDSDIIDIFVPEVFTDGRAVRKKPSTPSDEFIPSQWIVYPGDDGKNTVPPSGMDPREWLKPIIITEIADPDMNDGNTDPLYKDVPRFIEMYVPNEELHGQVIEDDLKLVLIHGSDTEPTFNPHVVLKGVDVPEDGLIVVCNDAFYDYYDDNLCDIANTLLFDERQGDFGCDRAAIVHGDESSYTIVDIFGVLGTSCDATHDFTDARAVRLPNATFPEPTWEYYNWEIMKGADPGLFDPHVWDSDEKPCDPTDAIITEVADPDGSLDLRYTEIYFTDCAGRRIKDDVKVGRWTIPDNNPSSSLGLMDSAVPTDGFIILCANSNFKDQFGDDACDYVSNVAANRGSDPVAVIAGDNGPMDIVDIIDVFGFSDPDTFGPTPSMKDGRAVRKKPSTPSDEFIPSQWIVYPGDDGKNTVPSFGMDPRVWLKPIIITEIVDPDVNNGNADVSYENVPRFIEMYVPNEELHGEVIEDDLKLVLIHGSDTEPTFNPHVVLKGVDVPEDGLIVVCNDAAKSKYQQLCDKVNSSLFDERQGNFGCDRAAIVHGDESSYTIVDTYGPLGTSCGATHDFTDARAFRLTNATFPEPTWEFYHWKIVRGASPDICDPHVWTDNIPATNCNLVITEVASPSGSVDGRFLELYSDNCAGKTIGDDFELVHYDDDGNLLNNPLDLEGFTIGEDGFLLLCVKEEANVIYGPNTCDRVVGPNTPADNEGVETIALLERRKVGDPVIIDIFGFKPSDDTSNFSGGKAIRDPSATLPSNVWKPEDWLIIPGKDGEGVLTVDDMDPREWNEFPLVIIITELADPLDNKLNRFIELYSPNKRNYEIVDDLVLVRYEGTSGVPMGTPYINLKGMVINPQGFLVLCVDGSTWSNNQCTSKAPPTEFVGTTTGIMTIAILAANVPRADAEIIDIFGVPGSNGSNHNFSDGRAVRVRSSEKPRTVFVRDDWIIIPGSGSGTVSSGLFDPNAWIDCELFGCAADPSPTPPSPPTPTPPSAPSKGSPSAPSKGSPSAPSKGKSPKSSPGKMRGRRAHLR